MSAAPWVPLPGWRLAAQTDAQSAKGTLPPDWRVALAERLGQRPRRIGLFAELALHGALQCLERAGETVLPPSARLRVASLSGAQAATRAGIGQVCAGVLPLPFDFMQGQPAFMLAALGQGLRWRGDASFATGRDLAALARIGLHGAAPQGLLLGRVEQNGDVLHSAWWRWVRD